MNQPATLPPPLYQLTAVTQTYNGRTVLAIDRLQIIPGEILALVGPSGAGKSTLLRLLAFLEKPGSGQIRYQNQLCGPEWPDLHTRRQVSMVFQRPQLLRRSVMENVAFGLGLRKIKENGQATAVMEKLGLTALAEAPAQSLSGGEMQRVALGRALVLQPQVLLLDEPTANLDPYNIKLIEAIIQDANRNHQTTMVMVTHNVFQAQRLAQRVGLVLDGRLIEVAPTEQFFAAPTQPQTAAFLRGDIVY